LGGGGGGGGSLAAEFWFNVLTPGGAALCGGALEPIVDGGSADSVVFEFSAGELSARLPEFRLLELFALRRPMRLHNDSAKRSIPIAMSDFMVVLP